MAFPATTQLLTLNSSRCCRGQLYNIREDPRKRKKHFASGFFVLLLIWMGLLSTTCVTYTYTMKESTERIIAGDSEGALKALKRELSGLEAGKAGMEDQEIYDNVTERWDNIRYQASMLISLGRYQDAIRTCEAYIPRYDEDLELLRRYFLWQSTELKPKNIAMKKSGNPGSTMVSSLGSLHEQMMGAYFLLQDRENTYRYATLLLESMERWTQKPIHLYISLLYIFVEYDDRDQVEEINTLVQQLAMKPPAWMAENPQLSGLTKILTTTRFHYYNFKKNYAKAEEYLHKMIAMMEAFQEQLKSYNRFVKGMVPENLDFAAALQAVLADLQLKQGKISEARKTFREYEERMIAWQSESVISRHQWTMDKLRADIIRADGDLINALAHYKTSEEKFEGIRQFMQGTRLKILFASAQTELYDSLVSVLMEVGEHGQAFEYSERSRARAFLDMMGDRRVASKSAESAALMKQRQQVLDTLKEQNRQLSKTSGEQLESTSRGLSIKLKELDSVERAISDRFPELASTITVRVEPLSVLQATLDPGTKVIEYYLIDEELYIWIIEKSQIRGARVESAGKPRIEKLVQQLRNSLSADDSLGFERSSETLYDLLIRPVADAIRGADRLCIIPHNVLHYLPFGLLKHEETYLLEDYAVLYAPSVNIYAICREKRTPKRFSILALGNPDLGDRALYLPFAEEEVERIGRSFPDALVYTGKDATEERFLQFAPDRSVIHLAAHGFYDSLNPMRSGIVLAGMDSEARNLTAAEVYNTILNAYMVVLSACETALGTRTDGDEIIGLTRAFMYAGSPSVISTLWNVNDEATAFLMTAFYDNLSQMDKAEALRQAQLQTKRRYPNPFLWGAFVLSGDWE